MRFEYISLQDACHYFPAISGEADISFAVDTSSRDEVLKMIGTFIREMVKPLPVETQTSRVALVEYNSEASAKLFFTNSSKSTLSLVIDALESKPGPSDVISAINFAVKKIFSPSMTRPKTKKSLVLFTNGENPIGNFEILNGKLKELNNSGIEYIIMDVGREPANGQRLKHIAQNHGKIAIIKDVHNIPEAMPDILQLARIRKGAAFLFSSQLFPI